jgi:hypothetical protein
MAEIETFTLSPHPDLSPPDTSADVRSVNRLVRRTGCTIREATLQLEGKPLDEQSAIATRGKPDRTPAREAALADTLKLLGAAKIGASEPCPFGAPKRGPIPTWGEVVARMVSAGEEASLPALLKRVQA